MYTATKAFTTYLSMAFLFEKSEEKDLELLDYHCFVPFGTSTNIVEQPIFLKMATTTKDVIDVALRDLGQFDLSYGTLMNELLAKLSFVWIGKYLPILFDLIMRFCSTFIQKY